MHPFSTYVLHSYYRATGWNDDNLYSNLTRSSRALLEFALPQGLMFNISNSPNSLFKTTYSMNALPALNGSVGYIFTSCDLDVKGSNNVRLKELIDRFKVYDTPRRPEGKEEVWQDYLLYGRIYIPTARLDALYSTRLARTFQFSVAAISNPIPSRPPSLAYPANHRSRNSDGNASNVMFSVQHDTGRWCSEYTYSADDGMWGARILHNFGRLAQDSGEVKSGERVKRVDEEDAMEGGLKGRLSAGAEFYFSAREKSGGVSTGLRFTTLQDPKPSPSTSDSSTPTTISQPPTTITAIYNPIMGHISTAYTARVSRNLSVCSRFDFNVYSYESEWTMGAEWWMRKGSKGKEKESIAVPAGPEGIQLIPPTGLPPAPEANEIQGVVKARVSTRSDIALMWEGRLRNALFSLGVISDLSNRSKPISSMGLELAYFSSG
ncbi:Mitochondrial distribution and morphology protein 10 [Tulasnella sp. 403]|nr:Mitochondrial distribution and morphology protein 10 [Tulasnella sp. 403]